MTTDRKSCPFCGSNDLLAVPFYDESCIECANCKMQGPISTYDKLENVWNDRANYRPEEVEGKTQRLYTREGIMVVISDYISADEIIIMAGKRAYEKIKND